jgi:hypothetical protein
MKNWPVNELYLKCYNIGEFGAVVKPGKRYEVQKNINRQRDEKGYLKRMLHPMIIMRWIIFLLMRSNIQQRISKQKKKGLVSARLLKTPSSPKALMLSGKYPRKS